MSAYSKQELLDRIAYPPTHTYDIETMEPTGVLAERVKLILAACPDLFDTDSFLDIGCSKGWFALRAARTAKRVLAFDSDAKPVNLLRAIAPENCEVRCCSFAQLDTKRVFRRIFMGNCLHHIYRAHGGWSFIDRLADLACGKVVIEAPTGMECRDMESCIPPELRGGFCEQAFMDAMSRYFVLEDKRPTVSYTPDRYIMVFKCAGRVNKAPGAKKPTYADYLKHVYRKIASFVRRSDTIAEVCCREDRGVLSREILPHKAFFCVDKDSKRGGVHIDVRSAQTPECDVLISTAIMHHTEKSEWDAVLRNLTARTRRAVFLTGPHEDVTPEVYGDHKAHLDPDYISELAKKIEWRADCERIGLTYPLCELFVAMSRP